MRLRGVAITVVALAALCCFSGSAWAIKGPGQPPSRQWIDVELAGSNGYAIHLSVNPRRHLVLQVSKDDFAAEYMTRDLLPETDRVKAKLLGLGTISLRFHARGPVRHPLLPGCQKWRPTVQPGVVRGTVKFVGERNYTRVTAREAEATIEAPKRWTCRYGSPFEFDSRERKWTSKFSASGEGVFFLARRYRPALVKGSPVIFFAEAGEAFEAKSDRTPLTIYRQMKVFASAATFDDAHPEHLRVSPPPPFSGTAAIARTAESVFTWKGDLSVQFPGLDPLPLTEPSYGFDYCLREVGCFKQDAD
jgi:hypothetical protein